ncbi:hypothetical protein [Sphingopyxis sp. JAI128]|uniref:hypothetical protein n=1 Tax=Sphingopyxis sp. JAI128 TaxID=2723066 RepID=UPI00162141BD|nr:hypothetical protein [Sphingopyxis sp. JAI128]MBB6426049.1 hypothetical protein [Sphingopyxis sp. JAI128]
MLLIAVAVLAGSCASPSGSGSSSEGRATAIDPKIERLARQSCLCKFAGHDSSKVDEALKTATAGLETGGFGESSAPLAGSYTCYPELGERACTATYYVTGSQDSPDVCNLDQVTELEKAWKSAPPARDGSTGAANDALQKRLSELRRSVANSIPASACN